MQPNWKQRLSSRKLWTAIGGLLTIVLTDWSGMDPDLAQWIIGSITAIVAAYVSGQGVVDAVLAFAQGKMNAAKVEREAAALNAVTASKKKATAKK